MRPTISFDFDGTLEHLEVQVLAKELIDQGYDVCILTTRYSDPLKYEWAKSSPKEAEHLHDELYRIAKNLGITKIHFTEYQWKTTVIDELAIDIHVDDNYRDEVAVINWKNKAKAVSYIQGNIKRTRNEIIALINKFSNQS